MRHSSTQPFRSILFACSALLFLAACGSGEPGASGASDDADATTTSVAAAVDGSSSAAPDDTALPDDTLAGDPAAECQEIAALYVTRGSANPDLEDPEVAASCEGNNVVVTSNAVPDYTYIGTSPGSPGGREYTFTITSNPVMADAVTDVPYIGPIGVTLGGIPIYGPTEGTGGDVDSLPGIVSACGSHNGPTGFHTHKILTSTETDCFFTPEEVAAAPQLAGYAFDGVPIYTGIDQYTSSWKLTDETLFASDTWAAHSYVEGSGDLDRCNGLTDADGNYAYYTTEAFPYVLGCFAGEVDIVASGGGGGGADGEGERPERPQDEGGDERPERPADEGVQGEGQ